MLTLNIIPPANIAETLNKFPVLFNLKARQAVKATMSTAKATAKEAISRRYIRPAIGIRGLKVKTNGLTGEMTSKNSRLSLRHFKHSPTRRLKIQPSEGVFVNIVKGAGGNLRRAFIAKNAIWERIGKKRLPIRRLSSLAPAQHLSSVPVSAYIVEKLSQKLSKNLVI